jgi:YD repeat-containing protein
VVLDRVKVRRLVISALTNATVALVLTAVTVSVEWKVDTTASIATLGSQAYVGGTARGTELVNAAQPTADSTQTYTVSGLTRADLLNGAFEVQVRASRGNSNTAFTASLDAVSVQVDYTVPGSPAVAPTYDNNGNMTSDGSYGNRAYAYDTLGRLVSATAGGATTTYALDGSGNRWSQTTGGVTTSFDLDLLAPNPTILGDGTARYLPGSPGTGHEAGGSGATR